MTASWKVGFTEDFVRGTVRIMIGEERPDGRFHILLEDGTWVDLEPNEAASEDAGVVLPLSALDALLDALLERKGAASHARTEAAVLREWLAVERARVDAAMRIGSGGGGA